MPPARARCAEEKPLPGERDTADIRTSPVRPQADMDKYCKKVMPLDQCMEFISDRPHLVHEHCMGARRVPARATRTRPYPPRTHPDTFPRDPTVLSAPRVRSEPPAKQNNPAHRLRCL